MTHLGRRSHNPKCTERVIQKPLVRVLVQTSDEEVNTDVQLFFITSIHPRRRVSIPVRRAIRDAPCPLVQVLPIV